MFTGANHIRQTEIQPLVPEVAFAVERLKRYKLPGIDRITKVLVQAGGEYQRPGSTNSLMPCYEKD
jgi:hypothetical protein